MAFNVTQTFSPLNREFTQAIAECNEFLNYNTSGGNTRRLLENKNQFSSCEVMLTKHSLSCGMKGLGETPQCDERNFHRVSFKLRGAILHRNYLQLRRAPNTRRLNSRPRKAKCISGTAAQPPSQPTSHFFYQL